MFIQTEKTPNPSTLKFIPGSVVLPQGTLQVSTKEQAQYTPLAKELFAIDGVKAIFFGYDFLSVTKEDTIDWAIIQPDILSVIMNWFVNGKPVVVGDDSIPTSRAKMPTVDDTDPLIIQIKELIETRVRPAVAQDGGDIIFHSFENGVVKLVLHGSCSGCPSSLVTLKNGVENMLKYYVPEVESVEAVDQE